KEEFKQREGKQHIKEEEHEEEIKEEEELIGNTFKDDIKKRMLYIFVIIFFIHIYN
ncbi:hypothetical protein Mgra_00008729, partial [Meloidogyne graminicola]